MDTSDTASYLYDGHGRRVKHVNAQGTNYSFYDKAGRLIYREKADGKKVSYVFLAKLQVARIEDGLATYIHTDLLGSPVVESDASRTVLEGTRMHYRPFGQTIEAPKDEVGYTGHKFDTDIGLVYAQQRYYDSEIGRFYADDPVSYTDENPVMSFNRYLYVNNNPYKFTDPDGKYLLGLNFGANISLGHFNASISISAAVDHNGKAQLTVTPELGVSSSMASAGVFARVMGGGSNTTVDSLDGAGISVSGNMGPVSLSMTAPADGPYESGNIAYNANSEVFEVGLTRGIGDKVETAATVGVGMSVETTVLGDIGRSIGSNVYKLTEADR